MRYTKIAVIAALLSTTQATVARKNKQLRLAQVLEDDVPAPVTPELPVLPEEAGFQFTDIEVPVPVVTEEKEELPEETIEEIEENKPTPEEIEAKVEAAFEEAEEAKELGEMNTDDSASTKYYMSCRDIIENKDKLEKGEYEPYDYEEKNEPKECACSKFDYEDFADTYDCGCNKVEEPEYVEPAVVDPVYEEPVYEEPAVEEPEEIIKPYKSILKRGRKYQPKVTIPAPSKPVPEPVYISAPKPEPKVLPSTPRYVKPIKYNPKPYVRPTVTSCACDIPKLQTSLGEAIANGDQTNEVLYKQDGIASISYAKSGINSQQGVSKQVFPDILKKTNQVENGTGKQNSAKNSNKNGSKDMKFVVNGDIVIKES